MQKVRGIRGATTVTHDDQTIILDATKELIDQIVTSNEVQPDDVCSVFITVTHDLTATFPALAVRQMAGWDFVPIMCALEINVTNSLPLCIRLMVLVNTDKPQRDITHVYLREATRLRPDLATSTVS